MFSPKFKRLLFQVIPFGMVWFIFSAIYGLIEKGIMGNGLTYPSTGNPYSGFPWITLILATLAGLLIGTAEVLYLNSWFNDKGFARKVIFKTGLYLLFIMLFLLINAILGNALDLQTDIFDPRVWEEAGIFFSDFAFWSIVIYVGAIISMSLFFMEVSDNIGQEVLLNFLTGKYHYPTEEERIFMFLDMKSSTSIAEKLGHVKYFNMLREYYADLSAPIIEQAGEIYQYVGDEIVVSWKLKKGLQNHNCIRTFFEMKKALQKQGKKYQKAYGLVPSFKAGLHYGRVTTGEIGQIKKEIIFTGDVLNASARIQSLCNQFEVDLLISGPLLEVLALDGEYKALSLGETTLRGRHEKMNIFTLASA